MVYQLTYRRPVYQDSSPASSIAEGGKHESEGGARLSTTSSRSMCNGIPEPLSFDRIINGGTCPPCTLRDFINFLKYIAHDAENLQFFLWFKSYRERFDQLPEGEKALSPDWSSDQDDLELTQSPKSIKVSAQTAAILKGTALDPLPKTPSASTRALLLTDASSWSLDGDHKPVSERSAGDISAKQSSQNTTGSTLIEANAAFKEAGLQWKPFTIQPFRDELTRVISIYIADGAPRQLNLSSRERHALLHALENTTHPSAFAQVMHTVECTLRHQAHPNFIRWTICNGNRPRVIFARGLGIAGILAGVMLGLLLTLSTAGRAWRVLALIPFLIGISTLIAAWKGMCVVLHGMHHRHLRPWELFQDEDDESVQLQKASFESISSGTSSNSYEDEPWVAKYEERLWIRKVFDRELWIEEPALRQIQDTIFVQAILGAVVGAAILTAIFVAVPAGSYY